VVAIVAFTAFVTSSLNLFAAAAVEIRGGGLHSGPLERLDARGVRVGGRDFAWAQIAEFRRRNSGEKPGLHNVLAHVYRGKFSEVPDPAKVKPSYVDPIPREYVNQWRLGNSEGVVVFTGQLNVPRAGRYQFDLATDDGGQLFIDGQSVVQTPLELSLRQATGTLDLKAGIRSFRLVYRNVSTYGLLELHWSGPGLARTALSAYTDRPGQMEPPAIPAAGVLTWDGQFIARPIANMNATRVSFVGQPENIRLSVVNTAAVFFGPVSQAAALRLRTGSRQRTGVILSRGEFIEGDVLSITNNQVRLKTLLFGEKSYTCGSAAQAVIIQKPGRVRERWRVQLRNGTECMLTRLQWKDGKLIANKSPFRNVPIAPEEIAEVAFGKQGGLLRRAWENWDTLDENRQKFLDSQSYKFVVRHGPLAEARHMESVYAAKLQTAQSEWDAERQQHTKVFKQFEEAQKATRESRRQWAEAQAAQAIAQGRRNAAYTRLNHAKNAHASLTSRQMAVAKQLADFRKQAQANAATETSAEDKQAKEWAAQLKGLQDRLAKARTDYAKAQQSFKGDLGPVKKTAAVAGTARVVELSESDRANAQRMAPSFVQQRDEAKRNVDAAKRALDAAKRIRDGQVNVLKQATTAVDNLLSKQQEPAVKKLEQLWSAFADGESNYYEAKALSEQAKQPLADAKSFRSEVDKQVKALDSLEKTLFNNFRTDEKQDAYAKRNRDSKQQAVTKARGVLFNHVQKTDQSAYVRSVKAREDFEKASTQAKANPDDKALEAKADQAEDALNAAENLLGTARASTSRYHRAYQAAQKALVPTVVQYKKTQQTIVERRADLAQTKERLLAKKEEAAKAKVAEDATNRAMTMLTGKMNQTRPVMEAAERTRRQAITAHDKANNDVHTAREKMVQAIARLDQLQQAMDEAEYSHNYQGEFVRYRELELTRRMQVQKAIEAAKTASVAAHQRAQSAQKAIGKPLDGPQQNLANLRGAELRLAAELAQREKYLATEKAQVKLYRGHSDGKRAVMIKNYETKLKRADALLAKAKTEFDAATEAFETAEATLKASTEETTDSQKLFDARNRLLDVAYSEYNSSTSKLGSLQRDESNARMILGNHQFTYRSRLAQKKD